MEYKFRGKRKDNGQWVYGSFVTGGIFGGPKGDCYIFFDGHFIEVIPETVGQFTGLICYNKKEIYEGDILLCKNNHYHLIVFEEAGFRRRQIGFNYQYMPGPISSWNIELHRMIVFTNKTSNPELLKPAGGQSDINNMNIDPNAKAEQEGAGAAADAEAQNAQESAAQDTAMEVKDSEEVTEG